MNRLMTLGRLGCVASVAVLVVACANRVYNPLDDYEEVAPATALTVPQASLENAPRAELAMIKRGQYLVELLGCANCHTDGALIGQPDAARALAGSSIGIAYSNPMQYESPGIVFPSNLTPDRETGIGDWTDIELMKMIRSGIDRHGHRKLSVMPWPAYSVISDDDALAMTAYLRNLEPINNRVPANVAPGQESSERYVHFGMYQSRQ